MKTLVRIVSIHHRILHSSTLWNRIILKIALHTGRSLIVNTIWLIFIKFWLVCWILTVSNLRISYWHLWKLLGVLRHSHLAIFLRSLEFILIKISSRIILEWRALIIAWPLMIPVWVAMNSVLNLMWRYSTFAINPFSLNYMSLFLIHNFLNRLNIVVSNEPESSWFSCLFID